MSHEDFSSGRTAKSYRLEENDQTEVQRAAAFFVLGNDGLGVGSPGNCDERSGDKSERIGKC